MEAFRLLANGKLPEYSDGHQHVHILPGNSLVCVVMLFTLFFGQSGNGHYNGVCVCILSYYSA